MGGASGVEVRAALRRAAVWGEAVQCGAGDGLLVLPHTIRRERAAGVDDSLGVCFAGYAEAGEVKVRGDLPTYLRYDGLDLALALAMGATLGAPARQGGTAAYSQGLRLAGSTAGLFATLAVDNGVNVDEYTSVKLTGFTLKGEAGRPLEATFHAVCDDRVVDSAINTRATFGAVTDYESGNRVLYSQGSIRMNGRDAGALGGGDAIHPSSFELTFKRAMEGAYAVGALHDRIDEPIASGRPEVRLRMEFPRYASSGSFVDWEAGAAKKLEMVFTGAAIEAPYNREFRLSFPSLAYAGADLPMGRGALRHQVEFLCLEATGAPAGMDGVTGPFAMGFVNRRDGDVLG